MKDCIFCKIIAGELPSFKIDENDDFLAFLTIGPFTSGHTLIIPKKHYRWIDDVPNFSSLWKFTHTVSKKIKKNLSPDFISYLTLGNEVHHAHIHIIPRYQNDKLIGLYQGLENKMSSKQLQKIADKIKL